MKKLLILDNYDSFTFNLAQLVEQAGLCDFEIVKNDAISLEQVSPFDKILLSPGPGLPEQAGIMTALIEQYASTKSILGICLGHQAIATVFGGKLFNLATPYHGIQQFAIHRSNDPIFEGIPQRFQVGLYHSWAVLFDENYPDLEITATSENGIVMAIRHRNFDVMGVQFHPESIMTPFGKHLINNWLNQ